MKNTRLDLMQLSDAELFAKAVHSGFGKKQKTRAESGLALTTSACYGCGYSDTVFWTIPYTQQDSGIPLFSEDAREKIITILSGEHWITWEAVTAAEQAMNDARKAHSEFLKTQIG